MAAIDLGLAETLVPDPDPDPVAPAPQAAALLPPPRGLADRYRLVRFVGAGAFGLVYEAIDERLQKTVAVKVLGADRSRRPDALARFRTEAVAAGRLSHPYSVTVTDCDVMADGRAFLVMEYVAGMTLAQQLDHGGPLPVRTAVRIAHGLLGALAEAHAHGVVHRDLKPANIIVGDLDAPVMKLKILDFGVAKLAEGRSAPTRSATGLLVGTPAYMAPEQIRGDLFPVDGRADLYAVGMLLYEMLTGTTPFSGDSVADLLHAQLEAPPRAPRELRPEIPRRLQAIVLRALRKEPGRRFATADDMARELAAVLAAAPVLSERRLPRLLAAALVSTVVITSCALLARAPEAGEAEPALAGDPVDAAPRQAETSPPPPDPSPAAPPPATRQVPLVAPAQRPGAVRPRPLDRRAARRRAAPRLPDSPLPL